jgi:hypothetical protein
MERLEKVIELLNEELDATPLPGGESYAIDIARDIEIMRKAKRLIEIYDPQG